MSNEYIPREFVFMGKRILKNDKAAVSIAIIKDDGTLGEPMLFEATKKHGHAIGWIYTGASFCDGGAKNLDKVTSLRQWPNAADRVKWKALHEAAESELRTAKINKDIKRINEIEVIMLPLRKTYNVFCIQHDYAGKEALEQAVLRALRSPPRNKEK